MNIHHYTEEGCILYIHKKTQKKLELSIGAQLFRQTNELRQKDGQDRQTDKLEKSLQCHSTKMI